MIEPRAFQTSGNPFEFRNFELERPAPNHSDGGTKHLIGNWLGGAAPRDVAPDFVDSETRFLCTLLLASDLCVSLFVTTEFFEDGRYDPFQKPLFGEADKLAQFVLHEPRPIAFQSSIPSEPQVPAAIVFKGGGVDQGPVSADAIYRTSAGIDNAINARHKNGGIPTFFQVNEDTINAAVDTLTAGYFHLLQLCGWQSNPGVDTSWDFGQYYFHVYVKRQEAPPLFDFRYHWG
jgi:hypothetical protein